jgi:hypothetical protein
MSRLRTAAVALGLLGSIHAPIAGAQAAAPADTAMPRTGLDFSGVDQFWHIVDTFAAGGEPTDDQWRALLATPGYRLAERSIGATVRRDIELAFNPARRAEADSVSALGTDQASRLAHLRRARSRRAEFVALSDSLPRVFPVAEALRLAQRFLPAGATTRGDPPLIAFAIFRNDAYSQAQGLVVDLLNVLDKGLNPMLGHELHHTYLERATDGRRIVLNRDGPDGQLAQAIRQLRNEGLADLVDKPHPLAWTGEERAAYVKRYNEEYARTPATLRVADSLLAAAADDSTQLPAVGARLLQLFWSGGHPHGAYIARTIVETFGVDSLFPAVYSPAALLRTYAAAERRRGNPPPFSAAAMRTIDGVERRHWRR